MTVEAPDPAALARRWAEVLGLPDPGGATDIDLPSGQRLSFVAAGDDRQPGIVAVGLGLPPGERAGRDRVEVCGVRFDLTDA